MRWARYFRVSSARQRDNCTIQSQIYASDQWAKGKAIEWAHTFVDDGVSSEIPLANRPDGQRACELAKERAFDGLWFFDSTRVGGEAVDFLLTVRHFTENEIRLVSHTEPMLFSEGDDSDGLAEYMQAQFGGFNQMRLRKLRNSIISGHTRSASEGNWQTASTPFGYSLAHSKLVVNEETAETLREMRDEFLRGNGAYSIALALNARHVPPPSSRSSRWHAGTVLRILKNPVYAGRAIYGKTSQKRVGGKLIKVKRAADNHISIDVPAIFTEHEHRRILEQVHLNRRHSRRNNKVFYMLRGLIKCGVCGRGYVSSRSVSQGKDFRYYNCLSHLRPKEYVRCANRPVRAGDVEGLVWLLIVELAARKTEVFDELRCRLNARASKEETTRRRITQIETKILRNEQKRARLISLVANAKREESLVIVALDAAQDEHKSLESARARLLESLDTSARERVLDTLSAQLERVRDGLSDDERRAIVLELVDSVIINAEDAKRVRVIYRHERLLDCETSDTADVVH